MIQGRLQCFDVYQYSKLIHGIKSSKFPGTFHSQRQDCLVFLYQDTHVPRGNVMFSEVTICQCVKINLGLRVLFRFILNRFLQNGISKADIPINK